MVKFRKTFKRGLKKFYKKVLKPYAKRNNRLKLYKEIATIKRMVNAEKKWVESANFGFGVGALNNALDGIQCFSITPPIAVGATYQQRNGNSIKLSGLYFRGQIVAQANTINMIRFKLTIMTYKGLPQTTTQIISGMYNVDSLSGLRDYNTSRNPDQFTDFRIITEKDLRLYPDSITGQQSNFNFNIPLKLTHHMRWNPAGVIQEGELFCIVRGDNGDAGGPNTGAFFSSSSRLTFYDN